MNTSQLFTASVAMGMTLAASQAGAQPFAAAGQSWIATVAVSQTSRSKTGAADRQEVDKLLIAARQAMSEGRYETADSLLSRAEAMKVEYGLFHVGDSPKKARHDLDAKRRGQRGAIEKPSQKFKPQTGDQNETPSASPVGSHLGSTSPTGAGSTAGTDDKENLPALERRDMAISRAGLARPAVAAPAEEPASEASAIRPNDNPNSTLPATASLDVRRQSDALLVEARKALSSGDVRRTSALVERAKALQVPYGFHDDSPAKVEALARKYQEVSQLDGGKATSDTARRQRAEVLMEQAEQLLRWQEFEDSERLANDAAALRVTFGPFDANPQALSQRIAAERKKRGATATAGRPADNGAAPGLPQLAPPNSATADKDQALILTRQARAALAAGQLEQAEQLARQANALQVPNTAFGPRDDRPALVLLELSKAKARATGVVRAGGSIEVGTKYPVTQAVVDERRDTTRNQPASSTESFPDDPAADLQPPATDRLPPPDNDAPQQLPAGNEAQHLFQDGEQALRDRQPERALELFRKAYAQRDQLDAHTAQRLQDHLQLLSASPNVRQAPPRTLADSATAKEQLVQKQLSAELARQQEAARKIQERDPKRAGEILEQARANVEASEVSSDVKAQLLRRVDLSQKELDKYVHDNQAQIELDDQNKETLGAVERRRQKQIDVDTKVAKLIDQYNGLMEDRRWAEAEVIAKQAQELAPDKPVVKQIVLTSKLARRMQLSTDVESRKEDGFVKSMLSVDEAGVPFDDQDPFRFPDAKKWSEVTNRSKKLAEKQGRTRRSDREIDIERKLKTPVSLSYKEMPLNEVLHQLAKLSAINLHLDPKGLAEEGVSPDQPVSIELNQDVSLKSALKLILEPLHLSYVIKDEVLKITSEQLRDNEVYTVLYSVADLVIPIPNFAPNSRMGLQAALADSMSNMGAGGFSPAGGLGMGAPTAVLANQDGSTASGMINPAVLAQMNQMNPGMSRPNNGMPQQVPFGPGGMGGGQQADFDSLIELITSTIQPTTWDEVGGPGSIAEFATNLSLVISQTQEVHEQIVDLLEQLRRLQDLQVTIEVRFITLNDNFFERIGVDFQFNIENHASANPTTAPPPSMVVGLDTPAPPTAPFPNFTGDLDIPFRQSSFSLATPQFGQPVDVARFGFAILSDIEAFFLVNAAQGDRRSNVLQAPKVTLFNGQQAFVSDTSQTPFVISVIPVVGDFAAAQQPVIVVLNEGTFLTVQAVISNDRRFVRLTVVPFFSHIGNVQEFTFAGSKTTTTNTGTSAGKTAGGDTTSSGTNDSTTTSDGVTVQLPTFSFVTVTTTVSVPDGGTVLLGGIKRLSEGRNEFGVPILSKVPYINRLFKNVGIGRETQSLMMMVTPRIIIQEEEEDRLGISAP